MQDLTMLN